MRILAVKGGGIRGLFAARLGARLEQKAPGWSDDVDVLAGTSTGAIIALARAIGVSWKEIASLYKKNAARIFSKQLVTAGEIRESRYTNDGLREVLEEHFGDRVLGELEVDVLIPSLSIKDGRLSAAFFTRQANPELRLVDAALASSAAPTYFPSHLGCLDGGLVANDPSVAALLQAAGGWPKLMLLHVMGKLSFFTLGCGCFKTPKGLVDMLTTGGILGPVAGAIKVLGEAHFELDPELEGDLPLDGGEDLEGAVEDLVEVSKEVSLGKALSWLRDYEWA